MTAPQTTTAEKPKTRTGDDRRVQVDGDGKIAGTIAPATPSNTKDAREVARWRAEHHHTEAGNAERWVSAYGGRYRYHAERRQWLEWNGARWDLDADGAAIRSMVREVRKLIGVDPQFVLTSESDRGLNASLRLASQLKTTDRRSIRVGEDDLNRQHHLLPVANGTVNLKTGELTESRPEHLMTRGSPVAYDPDATSPAFEAFLSSIFCGDEELKAWFLRWLGYCLTGEQVEQAAVFLVGEGANGKGVLYRILGKLLGAFVVTLPIETLMERRMVGDGASPYIANLGGARITLASEGAQGQRLDESLVKLLSGGDRLTARFLHANPTAFDPTHHLMVATNHKPVIAGTDKGIWRRLKLVPMRADFSGMGPDAQAPDKEIDQRLEAELPGILATLVRAARDWYEHGLGTCAVVESATGDYRAEMDRVGSFLEDTYTIRKTHDGEYDQAYKIRNRELYSAYTTWCDENGVDALTQNGLSRELTKKGMPLILSTGRWRGGLQRPAPGEAPGAVVKAAAPEAADAAAT